MCWILDGRLLRHICIDGSARTRAGHSWVQPSQACLPFLFPCIVPYVLSLSSSFHNLDIIDIVDEMFFAYGGDTFETWIQPGTIVTVPQASKDTVLFVLLARHRSLLENGSA